MHNTKDDEVMSIFMEESRENLTLLENGMIKIEQKGLNLGDEFIEPLFRAAHSIKASSNLLGMKNIGLISHELENILELYRSHKMVMNQPLVDGFLKGIDLIRELLEFRQVADEINITSQVKQLRQLIPS